MKRRNPKGSLTIDLSVGPNPDRGEFFPVVKQSATVKDLAEAAAVFNRHTDALGRRGYASSNNYGGVVRNAKGKPVAKVSWNGRVWKLDSEGRDLDEEIIVSKRNPAESPADIIARQLGGVGRLRMFLGTKHAFSADGGKTLRFDYKPQYPSKQGNTCIVTYNRGADDYTVRFEYHGREYKVTPIKSFEGIYAEQLMDLFERVTGLYLTLKPRR